MSSHLYSTASKEGMGLYVHIPFCHHICSYCDFSKVYYKKAWVEEYLEALTKEIQSYNITTPITTIYIGGGTPSSLSYEQLKKLLTLLQPYTQDVLEFTIEVNPESMDQEKLSLFVEYKVNRLSIGVQTFNETILKKIGRQHHNQMVFKLIKEAIKIGLKNISIDLMYNLPDQSYQNIEEDLAIVETLPITHLSYYSLILEEHTQLYNEHFIGMDDEEEYQVTELIRTRLKTLGLYRYEISNFAKSGYESLHNSLYWLNQHYYGFGLGSHGYLNQTRYFNTKQLSAYLKGQFKLEEEIVDEKTSQFETIMLGLRLARGISLRRFKERYGIELMEIYEKKLTPFFEQGLLNIEADYLKPTQQGMDMLDFILIKIMD